MEDCCDTAVVALRLEYEAVGLASHRIGSVSDMLACELQHTVRLAQAGRANA